MLILFGTANLQRVSSLQVCNWWILIKLGTSLLYFRYSHLPQTTLITEMSSCEFEDLELTDPWKNLQQKDSQRLLWMIFWNFWETNCNSVWVQSGLVHSRQSMRRLTNEADISELVSVERDAILNICYNNGCSMSIACVNIFTLNGWIFHDFF